MHEFSIIDGLMPIILDTAKANGLVKVTVVNLAIGRMRQVVPETLELAFEVTSKGTLAEGARLAIEHVPVAATCGQCGKQAALDPHELLCPGCGSASLRISAGRELLLTSIEGDEEPTLMK